MVKKLTFMIVLLGLLIYFAIGTVYSQEKNDPTQQDTDLFNAITTRLENNQNLWPIDVKETLGSFDNAVTKSFQCPGKSDDERWTKVNINITTKLVHWDEEWFDENHPRWVGVYYWKLSFGSKERGKVTVQADNWLALKPAVAKGREEGNHGRAANEGLLYHELLHGQLTINKIVGDDQAQSELCQGQLLYDPDQDHETIEPTQREYIRRSLAASGAEYDHVDVVEGGEERANEDGSFEITHKVGVLTEEGQEKLVPRQDVFNLSNIENLSSDISRDANNNISVTITGNLIDSNRDGRFIIFVDPPNIAFFLGIEQSQIILPAVAVGGVAEEPYIEGSPAQSGDDSGTINYLPYAAGAIAIVGTIALAGAAWYLRRHWLS